MVTAKIAWLIFIRANSTRFPGKCYKFINGKNIFSHLLHSAFSCSIPFNDIYLCTSHGNENKLLVDQALENGTNVLFGSEKYPIHRITHNWEQLISYDYLVRICGDSPLYPFSTVSLAVSHYSKYTLPIAITNTRLRNFPSGFSIEAYQIHALKRFFLSFPDQIKQEHMCSILNHPYFGDHLISDIRTKEPLNCFHYDKYTIDLPADIDLLEKCILNGYDLLYAEYLASIQLV